jgi:hypothetical protein
MLANGYADNAFPLCVHTVNLVQRKSKKSIIASTISLSDYPDIEVFKWTGAQNISIRPVVVASILGGHTLPLYAWLSTLQGQDPFCLIFHSNTRISP